MHAYYTLRHAAPDRQQDLRNQFVSRIQALVRECSSADVSAAGRQRACVTRGLEDMRNVWLRELQQIGNASALEEARLDIPQVLAIQTALQSQGLLPSGSSVDGVYGNRTREALRQFQTARGISATGFANAATTQALLQSRGTATAVAQPPQASPSTQDREATQRAEQRPAQQQANQTVHTHRESSSEEQQQREPAPRAVTVAAQRPSAWSCRGRATRECVCFDAGQLSRAGGGNPNVHAGAMSRVVAGMSRAGCFEAAIQTFRDIEALANRDQGARISRDLALRDIAVALVSRDMFDEALLLIRPIIGFRGDIDLFVVNPMAIALAERRDIDRALTTARSINDMTLRAETLARVGLILGAAVALEEAVAIVTAGSFEQSRDDLRLGTFASVMSKFAAARRDRTEFDRALLAAHRMQDETVKGVRLAGISVDQARAGFFSEAIATARSFSSARGSSLDGIIDILRIQAEAGEFESATNTASRLPGSYRERAIGELAVLGAERGRNVDRLITSINDREMRIRISARAAYAQREFRYLNRAEEELQNLLESRSSRDQQLGPPESAIEHVAIAQARLGDPVKALATIRLGSIQQRAERLANVAYAIPQTDEATEASQQRQLIAEMLAERFAEEQRRREAAQRAAEEQSRAREAAQRAAEEQRRRDEAARRAAEEQRRREAEERAANAQRQRDAMIADRNRRSRAQFECSTIQNALLENTLPSARRRAPIDRAHRVFENTRNRMPPAMGDLIVSSVQEAYRDPVGIESIIRDGQWQDLCMRTIMPVIDQVVPWTPPPAENRSTIQN